MERSNTGGRPTLLSRTREPSFVLQCSCTHWDVRSVRAWRYQLPEAHEDLDGGWRGSSAFVCRANKPCHPWKWTLGCMIWKMPGSSGRYFTIYTPYQGVLLVHLAILHPCLSQRKHGLVLVSTTCTAKLFLVCLWSLVQLPWALSKSGPFPCSCNQVHFHVAPLSDRDVGVWLCSCASRNLCQ